MTLVEVLFLPAMGFLLGRGQRLTGVGFALCNMLMMRMLIEVMDWIGYGAGVFGVIDMTLLQRGVLYFAFVHALYLLYGYSARQKPPVMFLSSSIVVFFAAHILFVVIMVL